eukprot:g1819.t1
MSSILNRLKRIFFFRYRMGEIKGETDQLHNEIGAVTKHAMYRQPAPGSTRTLAANVPETPHLDSNFDTAYYPRDTTRAHLLKDDVQIENLGEDEKKYLFPTDIS